MVLDQPLSYGFPAAFASSIILHGTPIGPTFDRLAGNTSGESTVLPIVRHVNPYPYTLGLCCLTEKSVVRVGSTLRFPRPLLSTFLVKRISPFRLWRIRDSYTH